MGNTPYLHAEGPVLKHTASGERAIMSRTKCVATTQTIDQKTPGKHHAQQSFEHTIEEGWRVFNGVVGQVGGVACFALTTRLSDNRRGEVYLLTDVRCSSLEVCA